MNSIDSIVGISRREVENLKYPGTILMTGKEIVYIAAVLESFWNYDYEALKQGRPGFHALLESSLHSDGFFDSGAMLASFNIRLIIAGQITSKIRQFRIKKPDWVVGIPNGATALGKQVAARLGVRCAKLIKENGSVILVSDIASGETLLLVEDFCTIGTGFKETVREIIFKQSKAIILPFEMVIINRGGLKEFKIEGMGNFKIIALAIGQRVNKWEAKECPLCRAGSEPIKPKATKENWRLLTTAQME